MPPETFRTVEDRALAEAEAAETRGPMLEEKTTPAPDCSRAGGEDSVKLSSDQTESTPTSAQRSSRSTRWRTLGRTVARKLRGRRIIREDFYESSPDVLVTDLRLVVECKSRKSFSFHQFIAQATKYCRHDETPVLVTKAAGQIGEFVTLPMEKFAAMLDEIRLARGIEK